MSLVIGLTGQVGVGKTFAADNLSTYFDFEYIDLDKIGHLLLEKNEIKQKLIQEFGDSILLNNKVNRKVLGDIVFSDTNKLLQLNLIVHPLIKREVSLIIKSSPKALILIVGALLEEIKLTSFCDNIILINAAPQQRDRILGDKKKIKKYQRNIEYYKKNADYIILNNYSKEFIDKLVNLVENLIREQS